MTKTAKATMKNNSESNRNRISSGAKADRLREFARKIRKAGHFKSIQ